MKAKNSPEISFAILVEQPWWRRDLQANPRRRLTRRRSAAQTGSRRDGGLADVFRGRLAKESFAGGLAGKSWVGSGGLLVALSGRFSSTSKRSFAGVHQSTLFRSRCLPARAHGQSWRYAAGANSPSARGGRSSRAPQQVDESTRASPPRAVDALQSADGTAPPGSWTALSTANLPRSFALCATATARPG